MCVGAIAYGQSKEGAPSKESLVVAKESVAPSKESAFPSKETQALLPSFDFSPAVAGSAISNLSSTLTINGTTVSPELRCEATGASIASWVCTGGTLPAASSGTDPTFDVDTPLLGADEAVTFNGGEVFQASSNTLTNLTTEDLVIEAVISATSSTGVVLEKLDATSGYSLYMSGAGISALLRVGASGATSSSAAMTDRAWYHVMVFLNRDQASADGFRVYLNGAVSGAGANPSALTATATNTQNVAIGAQSNGLGAKWDRNIAYLSVWKSAAWLDTGAQATVAAQRFASLVGVKAPIARGSAYPTVATRSTVGALSKCTSNVTSLFLVGANWPRIGRDCSGNALYRSEPSITNTFLQSRDLATSWTKLDAGDTIGGSVATPFGLTSTTAGLVGDATDGDHGLTQSATVSASVWTMSVVAKAGSKTWAYLSDNTVANATGYFNLSTCATGTKGAGAIALFAESLGSGWCRIGLSFTGTAASHTFAIQAADGDTDKTVTGDGATVMGYYTEAQLELWPHPTSVYPTTTATATRSVDVLRYNGTSNVTSAQGSLVCDVYTQSHTHSHPTSTVLVPVALSNAGSGTNRLLLTTSTTGTGPRLYVDNGVNQADITGANDVTDGVIHTHAVSWAANNFEVFFDGVSSGTDVSGLVPTGIDRITLGTDQGEVSFSLGGDIRRCRIFDRPGVRQ